MGDRFAQQHADPAGSGAIYGSFTRVFGITREQLTNGALPDVKLEVQ